MSTIANAGANKTSAEPSNKIISDAENALAKQKLLIKKAMKEAEKATGGKNEYSVGDENSIKDRAERYKDLADLEAAKKNYKTKLMERIMADEAEGVFDTEKKAEKAKAEKVKAAEDAGRTASVTDPEKKDLGPDIEINSIRTLNLKFFVFGKDPVDNKRVTLTPGDVYKGYKLIGVKDGSAVFVDSDKSYRIQVNW